MMNKMHDTREKNANNKKIRTLQKIETSEYRVMVADSDKNLSKLL